MVLPVSSLESVNANLWVSSAAVAVVVVVATCPLSWADKRMKSVAQVWNAVTLIKVSIIVASVTRTNALTLLLAHSLTNEINNHSIVRTRDLNDEDCVAAGQIYLLYTFIYIYIWGVFPNSPKIAHCQESATF